MDIPFKFKSETSAVIYRACPACHASNPTGEPKCPICYFPAPQPEDLGVISRTEDEPNG